MIGDLNWEMPWPWTPKDSVTNTVMLHALSNGGATSSKVVKRQNQVLR